VRLPVAANGHRHVAVAEVDHADLLTALLALVDRVLHAEEVPPVLAVERLGLGHTLLVDLLLQGVGAAGGAGVPQVDVGFLDLVDDGVHVQAGEFALAGLGRVLPAAAVAGAAEQIHATDAGDRVDPRHEVGRHGVAQLHPVIRVLHEVAGEALRELLGAAVDDEGGAGVDGATEVLAQHPVPARLGVVGLGRLAGVFGVAGVLGAQGVELEQVALVGRPVRRAPDVELDAGLAVGRLGPDHGRLVAVADGVTVGVLDAAVVDLVVARPTREVLGDLGGSTFAVGELDGLAGEQDLVDVAVHDLVVVVGPADAHDRGALGGGRGGVGAVAGRQAGGSHGSNAEHRERPSLVLHPGSFRRDLRI